MTGFLWAHVRRGRVLRRGFAKNTVCREGLKLFVHAMVGDYDQSEGLSFPETPPEFYCGLIDDDGFTAVASSDTAGARGWDELEDTTESTRKLVDGIGAPPNNAFTGLVAPLVAAVFEFSAAASCRGIFTIAGNSAKGNFGSGYLWNAAEISPPVDAESGDFLLVTYKIQTSSV